MQWQIGVLMALAILAMTAWSYRDTMRQTRERTVESLRQTLAARSKFDGVHFQLAQANTLDLRQEYLRRLDGLGNSDPQKEFDSWFERYPDGLIRVRKALDDHRHLPSVYIRAQVKVTPELRRQVWAAFDMLRTWGPALTTRYFSAYVDLPAVGLVMYSPSVNWGALADINSNNYDYPPVRKSGPEQNPSRRSLWSEVYFDDKAGIWMVSVITPVDVGGQWVASISQDMSIDDLTARTLNDTWPSAFNMILDADGRLLAHPFRMEEIRAANGNLPIDQLNDPLLQDVRRNFQMAHTAETDPQVRLSSDGRYLLGMVHIGGPHWHFVTVYPNSEVEDQALATARGVVAIGAGVLLLGLAVVASLIRWQIGWPLRELIRATEAIESGRYDVRVNRQGSNELGRLASTFNRMAGSIQERDARLTHLAQVDTLTGLANRYYLLERLGQAIAFAQRQTQSSTGEVGKGAESSFALLFLDLDRFKTVNDTLGHSTGDELLRQVAALLLRQASAGSLVARLGGDEFVVLVHDVLDAREAAGQLAKALIAALRAPLFVAGQSLRTSPSIGISLFPQDATDRENLLRKADAAMYRAKAEGRNGFVFFDAQLDELSPTRLALGSALHEALENREFRVFFQPKVELQTGALVGCEALLRWQRPEVGLLGPGQFLAELQSIGLMRELNAWVLDQVFECLARWQAAGLKPVPVAVNWPPEACRQPHLLEDLRHCANLHGMALNWLELEITEGALLEENEQVQRNLQALRAAGVHIAIDDFGTGYSALSYLHRFAIDSLKIDRSFVHLLEGSATPSPMTQAIIQLGRSLGLQVVAEGVETQAQADALLGQGCLLGQGYLFGAAEPADVFAQRLKQTG